MTRFARSLAVLVLLAASASIAAAQTVTYRVSVPEPEHHWLQVEVTFPAVARGPLTLTMSRSSPGRYATHEFAKNIFDIAIDDGAGKALVFERPAVNQWRVPQHGGTVRVVYRLFGDRIDGTYLGIDHTHAHMNMPATLMWAEGLDARPVRVTFVPPPGRNWRIASQLLPTGDPLTFTAPNLQYLLDSPTEFSEHTLKSFDVKGPDGRDATLRVAVHHLGTETDVQNYADAIAKIARVQAMIFGEFPRFEPGHFTFLADYLPWADGDGMEHRNSTVVTGRLLTQGLGTASHELFHAWNVERIRPDDLEPFNFRDANVSDSLWMAEGFTQYYGPVALARAGIAPFAQTATNLGRNANAIINGSGRNVRSAVQMSQHAPFTDAAEAIDRTDEARTFISYYTYGAAIALGLDLTLRERSGNKVTLDDYMRRLWTKYGKSADKTPGLVERSYSLEDLRVTLGEVADDQAFAREFFARYIEGRDVVDYAKLVAQAGLVARPLRAGAGWIGDFQTEASPDGLRVTSLVPFNSPAYRAGLDFDDVIVSINGEKPAASIVQVVRAMKPGAALKLVIRRRGGAEIAREITVLADPQIEFVPIEATGGTPTDAQKAFRQSWLGVR